MFKSSMIDTPLGQMIAIADEAELYLLEFVDGRGVDREIERLRTKTDMTIAPGNNAPLTSIQTELNLYFDGKLKYFKTPLHLFGSPFQQNVWQELMRVPYGKTRSYLQQAHAMGKPLAVRAVANANGANQIAIVIPCHRIINTSGELGGYGGGLHRKQWLLNHEGHL